MLSKLIKASRASVKAVEELAKNLDNLPRPKVVGKMFEKVNAEWMEYREAFKNVEEPHYDATHLRMLLNRVEF